MTLALCLILLELPSSCLGKLGFMTKISAFHCPSVRIRLGTGDVGDSGTLRCLHGKVDSTILCMCTCIVGFAQLSVYYIQ